MLVKLPRELRDIIYAYACTTEYRIREKGHKYGWLKEYGAEPSATSGINIDGNGAPCVRLGIHGEDNLAPSLLRNATRRKIMVENEMLTLAYFLDPDCVNRTVLQEPTAVYYSENHFLVDHYSLKWFLNKRHRHGPIPGEHVRKLTVVLDWEGMARSSWSEFRFEITSIPTLQEVTLILLSSGPEHGKTRIFYNMLEGLRLPVYQLMEDGIKVYVEHWDGVRCCADLTPMFKDLHEQRKEVRLIASFIIGGSTD